jgi:hypothetical protein
MSLTRPRPQSATRLWEIPVTAINTFHSPTFYDDGGDGSIPILSKNHLVDAHSFRHPYHPDQDWNEFLSAIESSLYPAER